MRWSYGDEGANQQSNIVAIDINAVKSRMLQVRGQQVLLDRDVAALYGVETRIINQAVKNNPEKFPAGYVAELTAQEVEVLRSKILTLEAKPGKGHYSKHGYKVFTERGLYMLATILKGERAVRATLAIVETYAQVRAMERGAVLMLDKVLFSRGHSRFVKTLLPKVVQTLTDSFEAFRTDAIRFDRNVRYARNECNYPLDEYGFRRTASVLALSVRRKEN